MITLRQQSSHFYLRDGTPYYEVPCKSKPGQMRPATLADARKVFALPSVTKYQSVINKPQINDYSVRSAIEAALTLPQLPGESLDDYAQRVVADADEQSERAKALGTMVHDAIADFVRPVPIAPTASVLIPLLAPVRDWLDSNIERVHWTEKILVNTAEGYAGRADFRGDLKGYGPALVDFKTQKVRGKPVFYDEWPIQLAAYAECLPVPLSSLSLVSVVINTAEPSEPAVKVWDGFDTYYDAWLHICACWRHFNRYDPRDCALPVTETETNERKETVLA